MRAAQGSSNAWAPWERCANPDCGRKLTHGMASATHYNGGDPWGTCGDCIGYVPVKAKT